MSPAARVLASAAAFALLIPVCGFSPNEAQNAGPEIGADFIVTAAPAHNYILGIDFQGDDIWVAAAKGLSHGIRQQ
jgi:hypothetical protein